MKKDTLYEMIADEEDDFLKAKTLYMLIKKVIYGDLALKMIKASVPYDIILQTLSDDEDDRSEPIEHTFEFEAAKDIKNKMT